MDIIELAPGTMDHNDFVRSILAAHDTRRRISLSVKGGQVIVKVGEGMWSAPLGHAKDKA